MEADVCKDELLDLFVIVVVLFVAGADVAAVAKLDAVIDTAGSWIVEAVDTFGGAACPTFLNVRMNKTAYHR